MGWEILSCEPGGAGVNFIDLTTANVVSLFVIGFIGGLVSGFIGSGGAFVLGVPAIVASATELAIAFVMGLGCSIKYASFAFLVLALCTGAIIIIGAMLHGHRRIERACEEQAGSGR